MDIKEFRVDILKQEIDLINNKINHFDNLRWRAKQMAVLLWTAAVGVGFSQENDWLFLLAAVAPLPFWLFDGSYRRSYVGFAHRFWAIRDFIRDERYVVEGPREVTLQSFLTSEERTEFPVPEYWPDKTVTSVPRPRFTEETRLRKCLLEWKILLLYSSMVLIAFIAFMAAALAGGL